MICLTKYVTVPVSKGEPNLYDGFWLARVSAVCRSPPLWLRASTRVHDSIEASCPCHPTGTHTYTGNTDITAVAFRTMHQLQNWNFSINNNYHCHHTDGCFSFVTGSKVVLTGPLPLWQEPRTRITGPAISSAPVAFNYFQFITGPCVKRTVGGILVDDFSSDPCVYSVTVSGTVGAD